MPQVAASMQRTLPKNDLYLATMKDRPLLAKMIADGYTGRKGKGGFYRLQRNADGSRVKEGIDLATGQYRKSEDPSLASAKQRDPAKILSAQDRGGLPEFARGQRVKQMRQRASAPARTIPAGAAVRAAHGASSPPRTNSASCCDCASLLGSCMYIMWPASK